MKKQKSNNEHLTEVHAFEKIIMQYQWVSHLKNMILTLQIQYIPLPRTPLRPNRVDQHIGIILLASFSVLVWDSANKHERQFSRKIAPEQAQNTLFDTTLISLDVTY